MMNLYRKKQLALARLKGEFRSFIGLYPELFFPLVRLKSTSQKLAVGKHTELVIEGFPRSSNSFALAAFQLAQSRPVAIATHLHAPAQIVWAARNNIPTLVVIRKPADAVLSLRALDMEISMVNSSHVPSSTMPQLLKHYIRFYTRILPYRDHYVLGLFDEVTKDFGTVIEKINKRFNTEFSIFEHTEANVQKAFDSQGYHAGPSKRRQDVKPLLKKELESEKIQPLIAKAEAIYHQFE